MRVIFEDERKPVARHHLLQPCVHSPVLEALAEKSHFEAHAFELVHQLEAGCERAAVRVEQSHHGVARALVGHGGHKGEVCPRRVACRGGQGHSLSTRISLQALQALQAALASATHQ